MPKQIVSHVRASRRWILGGLFGLAASPAARAAGSDPVILTIGGRISADAQRRFTLPEIEALGTVGFTTTTPWYSESCRFDGVRLDRLRDIMGGNGTVLRVQALNDYTADIPIGDLTEFAPILATRRNGAPMPVSDKGPLFVIYPFDDLPKTRHHAVFSRSVWQVRSVEFR